MRPRAALEKRLDRLYGADAEACCEDLSALADEARAGDEFASALEKARALADPNRMVIVALLRRRRELCACEVQSALGVNHTTVSHHMRVLIDAGLVASEQRGKWVYYSLAARAAIKVP